MIRKAETQNYLVLLIVLLLAMTFSSLTLWLLSSTIKYPLFIFEIIAIIVLYYILSGYDFKVIFRQDKTRRLGLDLAIGFFLLVSAGSLLLFNIFSVNGGLIQLILALLITSFLPGYALINIFGLKRHFSKLEVLVLSYVLSYIFTGVTTLSFLFVSESLRLYGALSVYILLGVISLLRSKKNVTFSTLPSFTKNVDALGITMAIAFFAISYFFMYPGFAITPGTDSSQHYAYSIILWRTPALYNGAQYLFAHLHESLFIALSDSSLVPTQVALLSINLMLPLAFYIMAKSYLEKIDAKLPSIATMFWVLFTNSFGGFSWLYFADLKLVFPGQTQLQLLGLVADKTYNGTIYGIFGLWYVPATISFILLMVAIFLLSKKEIPTLKFMVLFFVTISALYLTHVIEAVVLVTFLAVYGIISKNRVLKIDAALKASIFSFITAAIVYYVFSLVSARFILNLGLLSSIVLPVALSLFSLFVRRYVKLKSFKLKRVSSTKASKIVVPLLILLYIIAFLSCFSLVGSFHTWQVDTIGVVPWFMYPLMLGITGFLSIAAIFYIAKNAEEYKLLRFFIIFLIFVFIVGTLVSISNLYFFNTGYWEKRFIWFMKLPLALLAPVPVVISIVWIKKRISMNNLLKTVAIVSLIGIIVLSGISTTFLNMEYWNITTSNAQNYPSTIELNAVTALKDMLNKDPEAWLITMSSTSASIASLAAPADTTGLPQLIYTASTPEMLLTQLYRHPAYSHPYIYVATRDRTYLNESSQQLITNYLSLLPIVFNNSEVTLYNATKPSFPQAESENILIVPSDPSYVNEQNVLTAYYILSNGLYNYTIAYDIDHNALNASTLLLSFDPPSQNIAINTFHDNFNQTLQGWSASKGTWNTCNESLIGGETGNYAEGILLSPISAENFNATVTIGPFNGNVTVLNYARFIYSWVNSANYRIADIYFNPDGYIYILYRDFVNGIETDFPTWPGFKTDLQWNFKDKYAMKLTVNGTSREVSINGVSFRSESENIQGQIGLGYYRFNEIAFENFSIDYSNSLKLRPVNDYVEYLNSGGRLIVLNTNGYEFFGNELFSISNSTKNIQKILSNVSEINLPSKLSTPLIFAKNQNATTESNYIGSNDEVPFITEENYPGGGQLLYVNVYPIVQAIETNNNESAYYELIGKLLDSVKLTKLTPTTPLSTFNGYVKDVYLENNAKIETSSILFPTTLNIGKIEVKAENSSQTFYNVTDITLSGYSRAIIETDNAMTQNGKGLYSVFQLNSAFSIRPDVGTINLEITTNNGVSNINNISSLFVAPDNPVAVQAKIPTVSALSVQFTKFYLQSYKQFTNPISGQDLNVTGFTEFSISISDSYKAISNLTLGSSFQGSSQTIQFNFLSTLPTALFWSLILLPVFIGVFVLLKFKNRNLKRLNS